MLIHDSPGITSSPEILDCARIEGPLTVTLTPGPGCTAKVEVSFDNKRSFKEWAPGTVSVTTSASIQIGEVPTHLKASRVSGSTECFMTVVR
jgi:hypothetical protein